MQVGQALSSRPDLLPPAYLRELGELQDRLPPFPTPVAMDVIRQELGREVGALQALPACVARTCFLSLPLTCATVLTVRRNVGVLWHVLRTQDPFARMQVDDLI